VTDSKLEEQQNDPTVGMPEAPFEGDTRQRELLLRYSELSESSGRVSQGRIESMGSKIGISMVWLLWGFVLVWTAPSSIAREAALEVDALASHWHQIVDRLEKDEKAN
jgi:hypothetical protein